MALGRIATPMKNLATILRNSIQFVLGKSERSVRLESIGWAKVNSLDVKQEVAASVIYAMITTLNVGIERLKRNTDIVRDLNADEWTEWAEIQMCLESELKCCLPSLPSFTGTSISDLIEFVSVQRSIPQTKMQKRCFSREEYCLAGCLIPHEQKLQRTQKMSPTTH